MNPFTFYKLNQTEHGVEVILYIDEHSTEFSSELGTVTKEDKQDLEEEAVGFVDRMFPSIKVTTVKIMAGAILVTSIAIGAITPKKAAAAPQTPDTVQQQATPSSYIVSAGDTLWSIATRFNTTVNAIRQANNLTSDSLYIGQALTIPTGNTSNSQQVTTQAYKVVAGDTLYSIALRFGTSVDGIKKASNLNSDRLSIGQSLTIPGASNHNSSPTQTNTTTYRVVAGDTLYSIALRFGTSVDGIKKASNLNSDRLSIGQSLTIPGASNHNSSPTQTNTTTYRVVAGDTLFSLANRFGTTVQALRQANQLTSDSLQIGQTLIVPSGTHVSPTHSSELRAEQTTNLSQEELDWIAKLIHSEARGESLEGQIAVGAIIINRVRSPLFPNNVKDVIFERSNGYYQFTPVENGSINTATPNSQHMEAAIRAANGEDPTNGALFFYNPNKTNSEYLRSRTVSTVIGNHTFAY